jgi:hypothetical protein
MKAFPIIAITDVSNMLAQHAEKRRPGIFAPYAGRLAESTEKNIAECKAGSFSASIPSLDDNNLDLTAPQRRYSLSDTFHQGNLSAPQDWLRRIRFVPQLNGRINSQIQEQFFRELGRNCYFLTQLKPQHHLCLVRLCIHWHNERRNAEMEAGIAKANAASNSGGMLVFSERMLNIVPSKRKVGKTASTP